VKKPDYLGNSKWEFRHTDAGTIEAKMLDADWLERFRAGEVLLYPGDALRVTLRTELPRGFDGVELKPQYSVLRVHDVLRLGHIQQHDLLS